MKRLCTILLFVILLTGNCLSVFAAHKHNDSCYEIQGRHVHSGNNVSGGECYKTPVYHKHSGSVNVGGECYKTPVFHTHAGDEKSGGECYKTPVFHTHEGNETEGGSCYGAPVYHTHQGSASKSGGCYTTPVYCGGAIKQTTVNISCNVTTGSVFSTKTWVCECGGTTTQVGYNLNKNSECKADHGVYYETSCNACSKFSTSGNIGSHTGFKYVYLCSTCGASYNTTGKCNQIKSFGLSCGKSTAFVEKYGLSCTKDETTVDGYELSCTKKQDTIDAYKLSCTKNEKTIESYRLSCNKAETPGEKVLVCKEKETEEVQNSAQSTTQPQPVKPDIPTTTPEKSEDSTSDKTNAEEYRDETNSNNSDDATNSVEETAQQELEFTVECGLMADGVWSKITVLSGENLAEEPYSWDGGNSWCSSERNVFEKDGTYYPAVRNSAGQIKTKKLEVDKASEKYAVVTDYEEYLTEVELKELVKESQRKADEDTTTVGYVQPKPAQTQAVQLDTEELNREETIDKNTNRTLATTAKMVSAGALVATGVLSVFVFVMKRKR